VQNTYTLQQKVIIDKYYFRGYNVPTERNNIHGWNIQGKILKNLLIENWKIQIDLRGFVENMWFKQYQTKINCI